MRLFRLVSIAFFGFFLLLRATSAQAVDVTLAWDPNTEKDLKGYGVYFSQGTYGPPYYQVAGYVDIVDLDDPENPSFAVVGLTAGTEYSIAVTAYDAAGNESYYSEPVCIEAGVGQIQCASFNASSSASSSSSGGGGGTGSAACFISTASGGL